MPLIAIIALGTPSAIVSPSLAPGNVNVRAAQALGFNGPKLGLNVIDRCSSMGVPPVPIVTDPLAATSPLLSTLNLVTPPLCPRRMLPALPVAKLLNTPAAVVALVLVLAPETPITVPCP